MPCSWSQQCMLEGSTTHGCTAGGANMGCDSYAGCSNCFRGGILGSVEPETVGSQLQIKQESFSKSEWKLFVERDQQEKVNQELEGWDYGREMFFIERIQIGGILDLPGLEPEGVYGLMKIDYKRPTGENFLALYQPGEHALKVYDIQTRKQCEIKFELEQTT